MPHPVPNRLRRLLRDRKGATAVEYGIILAMVVLALAVGVGGLGSQTTTAWGSLRDRVVGASNGQPAETPR